MWVSKGMVSAVLMALFAANAFADISGLYLRGSQTGLEAVQIVETSDGQLTGRYESYSLNESGKLSSISVGFDGSISKHQLVLHMKKSLDTLFTAQSISGEVHGDSIDLTWEGGAGTFQKAKTSERNEAMEQLNVLSAQIIWAHKAERAEKTYNEAKAALAELTAQMASLDKWMDITLSKYDALAKQYDKRENRLASMEAMNVDYNLRYNVQSEMYQLESDFYSLQSEVEQQRGDLDWDADSVKRDIRDVNKFCSESGALADQVPFCKQLPARVDELDALNVNLRNLFRKWDSRQSRAPAK